MDIDTYSRRLLSPFHGVQQVLTVEGGIAETMDGWCWKLYVANEDIVSHTGLSEVVYGSWCAQQGLSRSRIRGTAPSSMIETIGEYLVTVLETQAAHIPFSARDYFELWLLDKHTRPLALLESALPDDSRLENDRPAWHPGGQTNHDFSSAFGNAADVSHAVNRAAGKRPRAVWIERNPQGGGTTQYGEAYPSNAFPPLLIQQEWEDRDVNKLVADFIDWQAPWLLQLPLSAQTRIKLEQAAWRRPLETNRVYRLLPRILDRRGLTAARVKARFLHNKPPTRQVNEPFYPFVNE
jgi:hypothetical protein